MYHYTIYFEDNRQPKEVLGLDIIDALLTLSEDELDYLKAVRKK